MATTKKTSTIEIQPLREETVRFALLGKTPLIAHDFSQKARQELLFPGGRKTEADRRAFLKHDPIEEYRESVRVLDDGPTAIVYPTGAFKSAMMTAALDLPGPAKAQIGRLVLVEGEWVSLYGIPALGMDMVRNSDAKRTPDVRTRAYQPEWACFIDVTFQKTMGLNRTKIANLLAAAGKTIGIGDWRPEKGKGGYGQFRIVDQNDATFQRIVKEGGREAQLAAIESPAFFTDEAEELFNWFYAELERRGNETEVEAESSNGHLTEEEAEEVLA
jgi:hypothetical protein